jgi:choline dehydrogenase
VNYDYIIVGGGSSGCVTATRLVRELGARVLLLEAGGRATSPIMSMPAGYMKYLSRDTYLTLHKMEPQGQIDNRQIIVPQARVLGGGSSVNAMVYMRGQPADYDRWVSSYGVEGWGYADILPHFKAMEGNDHLNDAAHGIEGPLQVSSPFHLAPMTNAFVSTLQGMGEVFNPDFNSGRQRGVGFMQSTIGSNRRRCSAVDAYLKQVLADARLTLLTDATASRVRIESGRAVGVEYTYKGESRTAFADAGVVLAAGTYITPKLLMLSGIGEADTLAAHGIKTVVDLPGVGQNLQDHCEVPVVAASNGRYGYFGQDRGWNMIRNGLQYLMFKSGPVSTIGVEACVFTNPDSATDDASLQIYCVPTVYLDRDVTAVKPCDGVTLTVCLLRPRSRGTVRLASADPLARPLIDGGFLRDPEDVRLMIAGLRYAREILEHSPMRKKIAREILPGPTATLDTSLHDHCKQTVKTNYHPVGTARMGHENDPLAVVDSKLRVRGIEGLRVFDCSVMPAIVSGNTNAPAMAIAHRASQWLINTKDCK